jgi:hypothetical protein
VQLGGVLVPFADTRRGWRIMRPVGWNEFATKPGVYEMKWSDVVFSNRQQLVVTTAPVKSSTTSISALGEVTAGY